jgi:transposase-like protein
MTKARVEVVTSVERRRRWTTMEKEQLVAATLEPGASVSAVARQAGMHPSQELRVAVGTLIAERPPHRTVRAQLRHTAPTLGG